MWSLFKIGALALSYVVVFPAFAVAGCIDHWTGRDHRAGPFPPATVKCHEDAVIQKRDIIRRIRLALSLRLITEGIQGACDALGNFGLLVRGDGSGGITITVGLSTSPGANWLDTTIVIDPDSVNPDAPRRIGYGTHDQAMDLDTVTAHYTAAEIEQYAHEQGYNDPQHHEFFIEIDYSIEEQR
jgi:hypothetical protein